MKPAWAKANSDDAQSRVSPTIRYSRWRAARYDKLGSHPLTFAKLAVIRLWPRDDEPTS